MIKLHLDKEAEFMAWCDEEAKKGKAEFKARGQENGISKIFSAGSSSSSSSSSNNNSDSRPIRLTTNKGPESDSEALKRLGLAAFSRMKQTEILARKSDE